MIDWSLFLTGAVIGLIIAVPVGPIGVLCLSRALSGGPAYGLISGLGVATGDAASAAVAALGMTLISSFVVTQQLWLRAIGGIFLCLIGAKTYSAEPGLEISPASVGGLGVACGSTFLMTFSNPVTILSFMAIYAGWGLGSLRGDYLAAAALTAGVFLGSATWWVLLSGGLLAFRAAFSRVALRWVRRVSGAVIVACGLVILLSVLWTAWGTGRGIS